MNVRRKSFVRKVIYLLIVGALLVPLTLLSRPATGEGQDKPSKLAELREDYQLSPAQLGEIDPTSETIRLATLGMTGVAANILWGRANHYKKVEDWDNLKTTLDQIRNLQPNFISVWRFQAWNLSYNVSAEFDDYRDRYYWVKQGIKYLEEGTKFNEGNPKLLWDVGWFYCQKIGRSDERKQFRRLFRNDEDFHGPEARVRDFDNWLVGKKWYLLAQDYVDRGRSLGGTSPLIFHADPPKAQINYADNLNVDGVFGEKSQLAWQQAYDEWLDYGSRPIPTTWGFDIHLNGREELQARAEELKQAFEDVAPGLKEKVTQDRLSSLTPEQRAAYERPFEERSSDEYQLAMTANETMDISYSELAELVSGQDKHVEAVRLAEQIQKLVERVDAIARYRDIVNFNYWRTRVEAERTDEALLAHTYVHDGLRNLETAFLNDARDDLEKGIEYWSKIIEKYPLLLEDRDHGEHLMNIINRYRDVLNQIEEPFPESFPLDAVIERYGNQEA